MSKNETRPNNNQKVCFVDYEDEEHKGIYLKDEDMFFIGNDDTGDFLFAQEVKSWKAL